MTSTSSTNVSIPPQNATTSASAVPGKSPSPLSTIASASTTSGSAAGSQQAAAVRPLSYAQATGKKYPGSATIVSSSSVQPAHSPVATPPPATSAPSGPPGPSSSSSIPSSGNQRPFTNASPVSGKTIIPPAVPAVVASPAIVSSSSVIVNGASAPSGSHSRKSSMTSSPALPSTTGGTSGPWNQQNGLRMPPGQQPSAPTSIQFGSINQSGNPGNPSAMGAPGPMAASNLSPGSTTVPTAVSSGASPSLGTHPGQSPRISSSQTSSSPIPQPAASGGPPPQLPRSGMPTFGSMNNDPTEQNRLQRPVSLPPNAPLAPSSQHGHIRRDSSHVDSPGMGMGRGGMQQGGSRRGGHNVSSSYGNQYTSHHQAHQNHNQYNAGAFSPAQSYRGLANPPRNGVNGGPNAGSGSNVAGPGSNAVMSGPHYQAAGAHMSAYSGNRGGRSPALAHSLPSTPQLNSAQIVPNQSIHSPQFPYAQHLGPHHQVAQMQMPSMYPQGFDPNYYGGQQNFIGYPPQPYIHQPSSPRPQYQLPHPQPQGNYLPQYSPGQTQPMSRSNSQISEHIQRPPSGMAHVQSTPTLGPASIAPPPLSHPGPSPGSPSNTNSNVFKKAEKSKKIEIRDPNTGALRSFDKVPHSPGQNRSPVIVSSSPAPDGHHERSSSRSSLKGPGLGNVSTKTDQEKKEDLKAAVQRKVQEDMLAEKKKREEEARKRKEEEAAAEEKKRLAKEAEEARLKEEEERIAREKAEAEEKERKAAEEKRIKAEEEQRQRELAELAEKKRVGEEEKQRLKEEEEAKAAAKAKLEEEQLRAAKEESKGLESGHITEEAAKEPQEKPSSLSKDAPASAKPLSNKAAETAAATPAGATPAAQETPAKVVVEEVIGEAETAAADAMAESKTFPPGSKSVAGLVPDVAKISITGAQPTRPDDMPPPKRERPAPLNLSVKTTAEPALPSAALTALRSARFIENINSIAYPQSVLSPNPALNANAPMGKFKYEKDFLLQFQGVFTEKPSVDWDIRMRDTMGESSDSARPTPARPSAGLGPKSSRPSNMGSVPTMGSFGSGKMGIGGIMNQPRPGPNMNPLGFGPNALGGMPFRPPPSISRTSSSTGLPSQPGGPPGSPSAGRNPSMKGSRGKRNNQGGPGGGGGGMMGSGSLDGARTDSRKDKDAPTPTIPIADVKPLVQSEKRWVPRNIAAQQAAAAAASAAGNHSAAPSAGASASGAGAGPAASRPSVAEDGRLPPEMVQRKVKAALNKMTPEKFDKIADQILEIASQSKHETDGRSLRQVIQLTFEKATDEPNFSSMYAKFCKRMLENMGSDIKDESIRDKNGKVVTGGALFRKYLLNRCQEEFERGWKVNLPPKPEGGSEDTTMMSEEYYIAMAAKRRGLGLIQFIGELFKLSMLTERIMHECVKKLVDYEGTPEEEEVESLCKLLRTIGRALDSTDKSRPMMDIYFKRIQQMMDNEELPSRMRFMLLDIVELRKAGWSSKEDDKGPKTITEIREEAVKQQQEKEAAAQRANQRQRPQVGRGDSRSFSQGFGGNMNQPYHDNRQNQTLNTDDLRRLGAKTARASTGIASFGPSSMFASARSSSSGGSKKGLGPGSSASNTLMREESANSSRTATPPASSQSVAHANSFSALSGHVDQSEASESHESPPQPAPTPSNKPDSKGSDGPSSSADKE